MKLKIIISLIMSCIVSLFLISADNNTSVEPDPLKFNIPKGWPKPPKNIFTKNKLTKQGFELGRKLFHDTGLSKDGNISCGSCHQQFAAFATFDHDLSHGVNNTFSTRNAPGLFNLAWMKDFHWDGAINHIEVQPLSPLTADNEMGGNLDTIIYKINNDAEYRNLFKAAFGDSRITSARILKALAQFTGSLISSESKYDKVMRGEASFTPHEASGYVIFKANCASCHKEPLFTDQSFRNNGLSLNRFKDAGRMNITGDKNDSLKFKVPSLRNIQVTYPYMHDGRIYSIPQVIDHYINKIDTSQITLDPLLKKRIPLNKTEKNQLVYFLFTLTDSSFLKDKRFSAELTNKSINTTPVHH